MKVLNLGKIPKQVRTDALFTGGTVTAQNVIDESLEKGFAITQVNFAKGARNKFHTHTVNQVLIVTAGKGIVATEKGEVTVGVGDVIFFPAGEVHWHGATKDSEFSHLYVWTPGNKTTQVEK